MRTFENKTAVITGAGSGLGRALALGLNRFGAHVALCDLNTEGLEETRSLLVNPSLKTSLHHVDVSSRESMRAFAEEALAAHGQVDILINNAGISLMPKFFDEVTEEQFEKVININMWGVYHGVRAFLPSLRARPEAAIVNMCSLAGLVGLPTYIPYVMSKFAVRGLSESLQSELSKTNISVLAVFPGGVKTNIIKNAPDLQPEKKEAAHNNFTKTATLAADDAAHRILQAVQRRKKRLILGADAKFVLAICRLFPNKAPAILHDVFGKTNFQ